MKMRYVATGLMTGLAAAAIAAAPLAAASNPSTTTDNGRSTLTDRQGHSAIVVKPPASGAPSQYGPVSSPVLAFR